MTKLELMTVLRSMQLALKMGDKKDVEDLIKQLIADAEGKPSERETDKE